MLPLEISKVGLFLEPQSYICEICEVHGSLLSVDKEESLLHLRLNREDAWCVERKERQPKYRDDAEVSLLI